MHSNPFVCAFNFNYNLLIVFELLFQTDLFKFPVMCQIITHENSRPMSRVVNGVWQTKQEGALHY